MMALFYLLTLYAGIRAVVDAAGVAGDRGAVVWRRHGVQGIDGHGAGHGRAVRRDLRLRALCKRALSERWRFYADPRASWVVLAAAIVVRSARALRRILERRQTRGPTCSTRR